MEGKEILHTDSSLVVQAQAANCKWWNLILGMELDAFLPVV